MDLEATEELDRIPCQEDHVVELEERPGSELVKKDVLILDFGTDRASQQRRESHNGTAGENNIRV